MVRIYPVFILSAIIAFTSCSKELERNEYVQYVTDPDNGLRKDQRVGDFELSVMYEPVDYIIEREFKEKATSEQIEKRKEELSEFEHFQFRIKLSGGGNILKYDETIYQNESSRVNHFSFEAKNDFKIVSDGDTSYCRIAHYSRNYNLTPTIDLSLTFDKINKNKVPSKGQAGPSERLGRADLQLVYDDSQFGIGKVKFLFAKEDLGNIPSLKI